MQRVKQDTRTTVAVGSGRIVKNIGRRNVEADLYFIRNIVVQVHPQ